MPRPSLSRSSSITTRTLRCTDPLPFQYPAWPDTDTAFTGPQCWHSPLWLITSSDSIWHSSHHNISLSPSDWDTSGKERLQSTIFYFITMSCPCVRALNKNLWQLITKGFIKMNAVVLNVTMAYLLDLLWAELNHFTGHGAESWSSASRKSLNETVTINISALKLLKLWKYKKCYVNGSVCLKETRSYYVLSGHVSRQKCLFWIATRVPSLNSHPDLFLRSLWVLHFFFCGPDAMNHTNTD